jgi:hypothetical protein
MRVLIVLPWCNLVTSALTDEPWAQLLDGRDLSKSTPLPSACEVRRLGQGPATLQTRREADTGGVGIEL